MVVAYGGKQIPVQRITDAMWPRIDSDYAHRSFNTTLHRLRKLLGDERAIILSDGKVSLDERHFWLDTWAFNEAVQAAIRLLKGGPKFVAKDELVAAAERALQLYQGPFLRDEDAAWAIGAREELRTRFVRLITEVAQSLQESGDHEAALEFLNRGLEVDDLAEQLYRGLMLCYHKAEPSGGSRRSVQPLSHPAVGGAKG